MVELAEDAPSESSDGSSAAAKLHSDIPESIANPVRPTEFGLPVAIPLVSLFAALSAGLIFVYLKARVQGT